MRSSTRRPPGRPRRPPPEATHPITRRIRRLVDEAHLGNLREASAHAGLAYATLRDLYLGRTTSPGLDTLSVLAGAYAVPLEWFGGEEAASPRLGVEGELPPDPEFRRGRHGRRLHIPLAAWPLAHCFLRLERRLGGLPPRADRPVLGTASEPEEIRQRLTAFLMAPLLEAQAEGLLVVLGADPPFPGGRRPTAEEERAWIAVLRDLGRFWERILIDGE